jgi:hypothetical protein
MKVASVVHVLNGSRTCGAVQTVTNAGSKTADTLRPTSPSRASRQTVGWIDPSGGSAFLGRIRADSGSR